MEFYCIRLIILLSGHYLLPMCPTIQIYYNMEDVSGIYIRSPIGGGEGCSRSLARPIQITVWEKRWVHWRVTKTNLELEHPIVKMSCIFRANRYRSILNGGNCFEMFLFFRLVIKNEKGRRIRPGEVVVWRECAVPELGGAPARHPTVIQKLRVPGTIIRRCRNIF